MRIGTHHFRSELFHFLEKILGVFSKVLVHLKSRIFIEVGAKIDQLSESYRMLKK